MAEETYPNPVGYPVDHYRVVTTEQDASGNWVGSDMEVVVHGMGKYLVNIVTKSQYEVETMRNVLLDADEPETLLEENIPDQKDPFVLNDKVITKEILERKFDHRVVEDDLAACMWYIGPLED